MMPQRGIGTKPKTLMKTVTVITFTDRAPLVLAGGKAAAQALLRADSHLAARAEAIHTALPVRK